MAVMAFAPILITYLNAGMSRRRESLADATAIQFTRNPGASFGVGAAALVRITANSDSAATAHMWFSARTSWRGRLLATHPPLEDRIAWLRAMEGWVTGRDWDVERAKDPMQRDRPLRRFAARLAWVRTKEQCVWVTNFQLGASVTGRSTPTQLD